MRILFAGTGQIAVPTLTALSEKGLVGAVLTAPDAPGKRGKGLVPPPVKVEAERLSLPVLQPEHLGSAARDEVSAFNCDTLVSFCYGKIFGPKFLALFSHTCNIHPSALPKYRGPSPVYAAIKNGDRSISISLQEIALCCDEGKLYLQKEFPLQGTENNESLEEKVSTLVPELALPLFMADSLPSPVEQSGTASWAGFIKKEDGAIDFNQSAKTLHAQIRAVYPWPKAVTSYNGLPLYLCSVSGSVFDIEECECAEAPGTVVSHEKKRGFKIATSCGYLYVDRLQLPTKKELDSLSFLNGNKGIIGSVLR
ncbi:MAG: methionyl-tRNA formyltransferase [Sphaerochaetaceae bacterium]|nr:methionyl-tRNA formyltransferase [Sphaerochaetaceae bacterium]